MVDVCTPGVVLGAMLGNVAISIPMDFQSGTQTGPTTMVFTRGGKLIHPHTQAPQNTTISAVIALERLAVGQREFQIKVAQMEIEKQRRLPWEEFHVLLQSEAATYGKKALRAIVYENPQAAKSLPRDIFRGPFDERWGSDGAAIKRIYAGPELVNLEELEQKLELDLGPVHKMIKPG